MFAYIVRRLLLIIPTLVIILLVNFVIIQAAPGGPVEQRFFDATLARMRVMLNAAGPLDAIYVCNHGAMTATGSEDPDGALYALAREVAGAKLPVLSTVDLHANISQRMFDSADCILSYRTNPHVDRRERGCEAATLMRNHKPLRYMLNPHNTLYAGAQLAFKEGLGAAALADAPLITVAPDARLHTPVTDPDQAPLIVLVVGETVRAANVGLQGYARDTTPGLRALKAQGPGTLVYFDQVRSCGTNTHTSLPCLFSIQGQDGVGQESRHENLLDVLQRAGLAVVWLDNQSGCKGVCARVPTVSLRDENDPRCPDGECPDDVLLERLPEAVASLDPARRARGTVVVMHQMGSHGPAYHRRSTPALKAYQPECTDASLPRCSPQSIVNAYDNSIRQTDQLLSRTITWLSQQTRPTALLYVSDHGESLGENGLYLHGMPYSLAPPEQTHVPMLTWVSDPLAQSRGWGRDCLGARAHEALSHDHVFGTVLTLSGVRTQAVPADRHALSACR